MKYWTDERNAELRGYIDAGLDDEDIAHKMGKSLGAIEKQRQRLRIFKKHAVPEFIDIPEIEDVPLESWLDELERIQAFRNKLDPSITSATIRVKTDGMPIAFSPTSCWHLGGLYTFYAGFRERMNELLEIDRFYWGAHGDEYENFPSGWASTVFSNLIPPAMQKKLIAKIVTKLHSEGKLLYSMWSNHPAFEERLTGEDQSALIYRDRIPYFAGKGIVKLKIDKQEYVLSVAHHFKGNSQWNPNHAQRKQLDQVPQADMIISGHTHDYAYQELSIRTESFDAGLQQNHLAHLVQTGTAKSLNDPYSIKWFRRGTFIWPTFVLSAKQHKIHRVYDADALKWYLNREDF